MSHRSITLLAALVTGLAGAGPAAASPPRDPGCGARIVTSVTLRHDLTGCTGDGLVIAADGITLRLDGHTISGDGVAPADGSDAGVSVLGHRGVTISGGTVSGFERGVELDTAQDSLVSGLTLTGNDRSGISVIGGSGNRLRQNTARGNHVGIYLTGDAAGSRIEGNTVAGNEAGIVAEGADASTITGNRVSGNGDNLIIIGARNTISGNVITDALGCGEDCGGYGISLEAGQDNVIEGNSVSRTATDGIRVAAFIPELPTTGNVVRANVVTAAAADGIGVATSGDGPVTGTVVEGNLVFGSTGDGIHVAAAATTVTRNVAVRNAGYGIEATVGVHDGGGNVATANGAPAQCVNVLCRRR